MKCPICGNVNEFVLKGELLGKYKIHYFKCETCKFVYTEKPYWLDEAYSDAIAHLDIGLIGRNFRMVNKISKIILRNFNCNKSFLDYGGGYGMFVRMMRDFGLDFIRQDKYCENIFSKYFDLEDLDQNILNKHFEAVTAFEVLEHLEYPLDEIKKMFYFSDSLLFSTELYKDNYLENQDWWYFAPETGQHISFFSKETFKFIASTLSCNYYNYKNLHLLTYKKFKTNPLNNESLINKLLISINKSIQKRLKLNYPTKLPNRGELDTEFIKLKLKDSAKNN